MGDYLYKNMEHLEIEKRLRHQGGVYEWDEKQRPVVQTSCAVEIIRLYLCGEAIMGDIVSHGVNYTSVNMANYDLSKIEIPLINSTERLLIMQGAMDLESGHHLLYRRSVEQKQMIAELCDMLDTAPDLRTERQREIAEIYDDCTNYKYVEE